MTESFWFRDQVWPRVSDRVGARASAQVRDRAWDQVWRRVVVRETPLRDSLHAALMEETEP